MKNKPVEVTAEEWVDHCVKFPTIINSQHLTVNFMFQKYNGEVVGYVQYAPEKKYYIIPGALSLLVIFDCNDFDEKVDAYRDKMLKDGVEANHEMFVRLNDMSNCVETARQIVNHYINTGEIDCR